MLEYYFAALFSLGDARDLARSALPDAPIRPDGRRSPEPAAPTDGAEAAAPADPPAAGRDVPWEWDPCPCGQWGVAREDRHGCVALVKELFSELDRELDAWEAEHGWLYR
jgi:hypothetical protein